jgi:hypothetical protein
MEMNDTRKVALAKHAIMVRYFDAVTEAHEAGLIDHDLAMASLKQIKTATDALEKQLMEPESVAC